MQRNALEIIATMRVAFFEDHGTSELAPLALLRPVFELVCGQFTARERALRALSVTAWGAYFREHLAEVYREQFPEAVVNSTDWLQAGPTLLLHGRWLCDLDTLRAIQPDEVGIVDGQVVYITVDPAEAVLVNPGDWQETVSQIARLRTRRVAAAGRLIAYPWQLIEHNPKQLAWDFELRRGSGSVGAERPDVAIRGDLSQVWIDPSVDVDPYVVIDARGGPVSIEPGCVIQAFTRIEGPCHIGRGSRLYRAQVRAGTTIGPGCRVGGEVEASILHADINKYHDGFLGHSYVCPWVNLGAQTANSDLKNDYSNVRFPIAGRAEAKRGLDTGLMKVGCFIGDHTKTGLGSLFNTGSAIGVMCMVLPAGGLLPRFVPSFSTIWHGELSTEFSLDRSFLAAKAGMERRNRELTDAQQRLLRHVYQQTAGERELAIAQAGRALDKRVGPVLTGQPTH